MNNSLKMNSMKKKESFIVGKLIRDHSELLKLMEEIVKLANALRNSVSKAEVSNEFFNVLKDAIYLSFKISSLLAKLDEHMKLEEELIKPYIQDERLKRELDVLIEGTRRFSEIEREISATLENYRKGAIALDDVVKKFVTFVNELQEIVYQHVSVSDRILHTTRKHFT